MLSLVKTRTPSSAEYIAFRGQPFGFELDQPEVPNFKELQFHAEVPLGLSPACDLILNAPKRLCTTRHQHPWAFDRSPFNRGMPLNLFQVTPLLITSTTALYPSTEYLCRINSGKKKL